MEYKSNIHLKEIRTVNKIYIHKTSGLHLSRLKIRWLISTVSFYSQTWHCRLGLKVGLSCLRRGDLRLSKVSWHNIVQGKVSRTGLLRKAHLDSRRVCRIKVNNQFTLWGIEKSSSHFFFMHWPWSLTAFFVTYRLLKVHKKSKRKRYTHHHLMLRWAECGFVSMQAAEDTWLFFEQETSQFPALMKHHDGPVVTVKALFYCKG